MTLLTVVREPADLVEPAADWLRDEIAAAIDARGACAMALSGGRTPEPVYRALAAAEGALLVDLEAAFRREPDLASLFHDHVHPNDRGHRLMADEFFRTITQPR